MSMFPKMWLEKVEFMGEPGTRELARQYSVRYPQIWSSPDEFLREAVRSFAESQRRAGRYASEKPRGDD